MCPQYKILPPQTAGEPAFLAYGSTVEISPEPPLTDEGGGCGGNFPGEPLCLSPGIRAEGKTYDTATAVGG